MRGPRRDPSVRAILRIAVVAIVTGAALRPAPCIAQTEDELASARKLFTEAVTDQEAKHFDLALDKFKRVASVRNTANVRYRIASCLDALGRLAEALGDYQDAARLGESDRSAAEVVRAASARAGQLDRIVPRLVLVVPPDAPAGTEIRVDDTPVGASALRDAIPVDPGHHTIAATAPGDVPFRTGVTLPEGGRVSITVTLQPAAGPGPDGPPSSPPADLAHTPPAPTPPAPRPGHGPPAGAWVSFGVGGALAVGSIVSLLLRSSSLHTLDDDCTVVRSGLLSCPSSRESAVSSARNAAQLEGPLAIGLAAGAAVAAGLGIWLLVSSPAEGIRVTPVVTNTTGMLLLGGPFGR